MDFILIVLFFGILNFTIYSIKRSRKCIKRGSSSFQWFPKGSLKGKRLVIAILPLPFLLIMFVLGFPFWQIGIAGLVVVSWIAFVVGVASLNHIGNADDVESGGCFLEGGIGTHGSENLLLDPKWALIEGNVFHVDMEHEDRYFACDDDFITNSDDDSFDSFDTHSSFDD